MRINNKIINALAEIKIWLAAGQGYFMDLRYPVLLATALKVFFPTATYLTLAFITLIIIFILIFIGWFDLKFIKLMQTINEKSTEKYNPYFSKLRKRFK